MHKGKTEFEKGRVQGLKDAAAFIDMFNGSTTHKYKLGDCVLCKFNITGRKRPRKNNRRVVLCDEFGLFTNKEEPQRGKYGTEQGIVSANCVRVIARRSRKSH